MYHQRFFVEELEEKEEEKGKKEKDKRKKRNLRGRKKEAAVKARRMNLFSLKGQIM